MQVPSSPVNVDPMRDLNHINNMPEQVRSTTVNVDRKRKRGKTNSCPAAPENPVNYELEQLLQPRMRDEREILKVHFNSQKTNAQRPAWASGKPADVKKRIEYLEKSSGFQR